MKLKPTNIILVILSALWNLISKVSDVIMDFIIFLFSNRPCIYFFSISLTVVIIKTHPKTPMEWLLAVLSIWFQTIMLGIILYQGNKTERNNEKRHEAHFQRVEDMEIKMMTSQEEQNQILTKICSKLEIEC